MGEKSLIVVENLCKAYQVGDETVVALKNINLEIKQGEICCIFGTSGSGKSTLLNQLSGMEKPTKGNVYINGINVSKLNEKELAKFRQKYTGFVFQSYNLLGSLNALENTAMPLMFRGIPKKIREREAYYMLKKVGLVERMYHYPTQMSGGQQQRVGIARAFITRPCVVFADEPTGNLDTKTTFDIMDMIVDFSKKYNQTVVLVSHDAEMAKYADHIVTLTDGIIKEEIFKERGEENV